MDCPYWFTKFDLELVSANPVSLKQYSEASIIEKLWSKEKLFSENFPNLEGYSRGENCNRNGCTGIIYRNESCNNVYRVIEATTKGLKREKLESFETKKVEKVVFGLMDIHILYARTILYNPYTSTQSSFHILFPFNL